MAYVDGFLASVPDEKKQDFIEHSRFFGDYLKKVGALSVVDCWGDDVPDGKLTSMPLAVKAKPGETVVFSWIVWPDKAARDAGMQKMTSDPSLSPENNPMPFDGKRLIFGGFVPVAGDL